MQFEYNYNLRQTDGCSGERLIHKKNIYTCCNENECCLFRAEPILMSITASAAGRMKTTMPTRKSNETFAEMEISYINRAQTHMRSLALIPRAPDAYFRFY